jgi:uncharacterized Ntn-hydrolase superfamily protein
MSRPPPGSDYAAGVAATGLTLSENRQTMKSTSSRLAATYSIVARDARTGELGVAVQSNYFSVGTDVSWALAGVGAIATQSIVEVAYGPIGLDHLARGASSAAVLEELVSRDPAAALRQVAIVDAQGRVAAHTGAACVPACAHAIGDGFSVQGNMLASDAVWQAMGPAFETAEGDLADRLMAALEVGERAGGDVRGRQSAALLVVSGMRTEHAFEGRSFDLHVQHHTRPLEELRRLLTIRRAYTLFDAARRTFATGEVDQALQLVAAARAMYPDEVQFCFWTGVALANSGRADQARRWLGEAFRVNASWRELGRRLRTVGLYTGDPELLEP